MIEKVNIGAAEMVTWLNDSFKAVMDDISSGIIICGKDLKIIYINRFLLYFENWIIRIYKCPEN